MLHLPNKFLTVFDTQNIIYNVGDVLFRTFVVATRSVAYNKQMFIYRT